VEQIFAELAQYGPLGMWTVTLLVWHVQQQKKLEAARVEFMDRLAQLDDKSDNRESALRDRYDKVISDLQDERSVLRGDIITKLEKVSEDIGNMGQKVDEGLTAMRERYAEERALRMARAELNRD
jgi:vacuolar-type H+-ATPase subunit I/STV1